MAGLKPEDFEIYTTYEDYHYCKPNLNYYKEVIEKLGMKVFLLSADLINKVGKDISQYPQGGLEELLTFLNEISSL